MKKEDINEEDTFEELIPEEDEVNEEEITELEEVESDTELEGSGEDQTQTQLDVEEAVEEVENPTEEDKLATEVANSSLDVLIADEESAIEGYNGFLTQAKNTLLPPLYEVLEKEINEIIRDEEDHINKLTTIKTAFHLENIPLDESKKLNEGKIDYLKEIQNVVEQAQYYMDLDEFFKFLTDLKDYVDAKHYDNEPVDESKSIKTESVDDKNLANIKDCLNQSGIRNPHTVERMAKDVLAILNTYDEDTKDEDGLYYIPAITYAIQDKVERITGKRPELTIESKEIKTESVTDTEFDDIDSFEDLQNVIEKLYEEESINDDQYDEISDYISTRKEEVEKYIEERSKVTNTDEKDIVGIMEDNVLDAIEKVKEIINGKESKEITLDAVLDELGIMIDSPAEQEESPKIKEFMETHPEASLDQIVKAYKNYEETGLFECKEIKAEEEFPVKELNESNK